MPSYATRITHTHSASVSWRCTPLTVAPSHARMPGLPLTHSSPHPGATLRGHPAGGMLRDPHLAGTSHILSHPHSLSGSDSSSVQHTRSPEQPSGSGRQQPARAGLGGPPAPLQPGHRVESPLPAGAWSPPTRLLHLGPPLFPLRGRQTDPRTRARALSRSAPRPCGSPGSSLFLIMGRCACLLTQLEMVRE